MITVDKKNRTVSLIQGSEVLTFDLLVCYICPTCEEILLAYWRDDDRSYNPLQYLPGKLAKVSKWDPYYISFSVPGAKGIEARNHCGYDRCKYIYQHLVLADNLKEFIKELEYTFNETPIAEIGFLHDSSNDALMKNLEEYGATLIKGICGREEPMLFLDPKLVRGEHSYDETRIKKFLSVFGVYKRALSQEEIPVEDAECESLPTPKSEYELRPGNVDRVTLEGDCLLIPLIPLGQSYTTPLVVTAIYDLIQEGVSFERIKAYFSNIISADLTKGTVNEYIEKYSRYEKEFGGVARSEEPVAGSPEQKNRDEKTDEAEVNVQDARAIEDETKVEGSKQDIEKNNVDECRSEDAEIVEPKKAKKVLKQWDVPSNTRAGVTYKVTKYGDGTFACACRHWTRRRTDCSHIKRKRRSIGSRRRNLLSFLENK